MKQTLPINDSTPITVAVASKPKPSRAKKTSFFKVLTVLSDYGENASLRVFKIAAANRRDAKDLAAAMTARLTPEQIEAISVDACDADEVIEPVKVVDVYKMHYDTPGQVWTREQVESDDLDALVERAELEVNASDEPQSLAVALDNYTDPTHPEYDPVFDKQIRTAAPHWFETA